MAITLKKTDFTKRGWQALRPADLTKSGMGAALDKFAPYADMRGKNIFAANMQKPAFAAAVLVEKALGVAKSKADKIKEKAAKTKALEVVTAYGKWVEGWKKDLAAGAAEFKAAQAASQGETDKQKAKEDAVFEKARKVRQAKIAKLKLADVMKDAAWRKKFQDYCKKTLNEENFLFLTVGLKPSQENFNKFITQGASLQVNLSAANRVAVEQAHARGELDKGAGKVAWMTAVKEVYSMVQSDTFQRFLSVEQKNV